MAPPYRRLLRNPAALVAAALCMLTLDAWYLGSRWLHPDRTPAATLSEDPPLPKVMTRHGRALTSYYARWIAHDLSRWQETLISRALVERAAREFEEQSEGSPRVWFQIVNGTLWVDHSLAPWPDLGWYPAEIGGGWTSAKARVPYFVLALLETLREYPGEIPDVDAVMHIHDRPVVPANPVGGAEQKPSPPVFGYTATENFTDIPFPDFSYWGHEHGRIGGHAGGFVQGWEQQFSLLADNVSASRPLHKRTPQVLYRGRISHDKRDVLRRQFAACREVFRAMHHSDQEVMNLWEPQVKLDEACQWRYLAYIESNAWATNFKHKLACGSVVLAVKPRHYEFFARDLVSGVHYVEVEPPAGPEPFAFMDMCVDLSRQFKYLEAQWKAAALPVNPFVDLRDMYDWQYERRPGAMDVPGVEDGLLKAADAMGPAPMPAPAPAPAPDLAPSPSDRLLAGARRGRAKNMGVDGGAPKPWDVAANGQEFLRRHVRMEDVREYIRDVLIMYSSLQSFQPKPNDRSVCYSGKLLMRNFGFPYEVDRLVMEQGYPWLDSYVQPGCPPVNASSGSDSVSSQ